MIFSAKVLYKIYVFNIYIYNKKHVKIGETNSMYSNTYITIADVRNVWISLRNLMVVCIWHVNVGISFVSGVGTDGGNSIAVIPLDFISIREIS